MNPILILFALFVCAIGAYWILRARALAQADETFNNSPAMFVVQGILAISMGLFALYHGIFGGA